MRQRYYNKKRKSRVVNKMLKTCINQNNTLSLQKKNMIIPANYVCVKLDVPYSQLSKNEVRVRNIDIKTDYEVAFWTPRTGVIVQTPEHLLFGEGQDYMLHKTEMELKAGQRVWFEYFDCLIALGNMINPGAPDFRRWYREGDDMYVLIRYDSIVVAEGENGYYTVNGYVVMMPLVKKYTGKIIIEDKEDLECEVVCSGSPIEEYFDGAIGCKVDVGDTVLIRNFKLKLENDIINLFGKGCIYLQDRNILAKKVNK
jgi:co-chaperonin GroES (HSP10)